MSWVYRVPEHHEHNIPKTVAWSSTSKTLVGDRWLCDCGETFEVTNVKVQYDQRGGDFAFLSWAEYRPKPGLMPYDE